MARNKYGAKKVTFNGIKFDSIGEKNRYIFLKSAADNGEIKNLRLQVRYDIIINDVKVCFYKPDFVYLKADLTQVVEDFKGMVTPTFRLKAKLMKAVHGIDVRVVKSPTEDI